jgi:tRNA pseudouridine32 synthase/23S rRNA pseudouridine746 synthase
LVARTTWQHRMARGLVRDASGAAVTETAAYRQGLEVRYLREVDHELAVAAKESLVHVDEDLVVADKPHFLPVMPVGAWVQETLVARLIRRLGNPALTPLHRIDRATAGLVLFSARAQTRERYQSLFRERRIHKTYEALAPPLPGRDFPLTRCSRMQPGEPFFRMREVPGEPNTETSIAVLDRAPGLWRYELRPRTGRKHQLRVHMAALGAPILNDRWYPSLCPPAADDPDRPLALVARVLEFVDPFSGARRRFESAAPLRWPLE